MKPLPRAVWIQIVKAILLVFAGYLGNSAVTTTVDTVQAIESIQHAVEPQSSGQ